MKYVVKMRYDDDIYYLKSKDDIDCYGEVFSDAKQFDFHDAVFHCERLTRDIEDVAGPPEYYIAPVVK